MSRTDKLEVVILGTGTSQGVPVLACNCDVCLSDDPCDQRTRSSVYIQHPKAKILIDIGPDFRQQMLDNELDDVDFILLTHEHNDHVAGLDDIRSINYTWKKDIPILGQKRVLDSIKQRFDYAFYENPLSGIPKINLVEITVDAFSYMGVDIIPLEIIHGHLTILGYRIGDFVYITDAKSVSQNEITKILACKTLIVNALRKRSHSTHFNLEEALAFIEQVNPEVSYLTHLGHLMGKHKEINAELPQNVYLAYDGLRIKI